MGNNLGNIVLLGPPGTGKGTLATNIVNDFNFEIITMGEILRNEKASGSEIGEKIKNIIGKGNLVSDDIVNEIAEKYFSNNNKSNHIIDGYPRTIGQADFIGNIIDIKYAIYLKASDETITERILERGKTSGREDDSDINIIKNRLIQYKSDTAPLIDYYKNKNVLIELNSELSIDEVYNEFKGIFN